MVSIFKATPSYDFVKLGRRALRLSALLLALGVASIVVHRGLDLGVDFTGGTIVQLKFAKPVFGDLPRIRGAVAALGLGAVEIKSVGASENNLIQFAVGSTRPGSAPAGVQIGEAVATALPGNPFELFLEENVGPKVGREMGGKALLAVAAALLAIVVYMWIRFNFSFSLGAVVALVHDVFITIAFLSLTGKEVTVSIVAALLTIVGYSVNDTIVVFDRVREKLGGTLLYRQGAADVLNAAVNETLNRTINTSGTLLFVLVAFSFFAGEVIRDFAQALLVGCVSGVYSTVFVASPVALWWWDRHREDAGLLYVKREPESGEERPDSTTSASISYYEEG